MRRSNGILQGRGDHGGDIASNIDKNLALAQQGYFDFDAEQSSSLSSAIDANPATAATSPTSSTKPA
jgi:hypothetical protein